MYNSATEDIHRPVRFETGYSFCRSSKLKTEDSLDIWHIGRERRSLLQKREFFKNIHFSKCDAPALDIGYQ